MVFSYKLTEQDYLNYFLYKATVNPLYSGRVKRNRIALSLLYVFFGISALYKNALFTGIGILLFGVLVYFVTPLYFKWFYKRHYLKHVRKYLHMYINVESEITLGKKSVSLFNPQTNEKTSNAANEINELIETPSNFFLLFKNKTAFILPKNEELKNLKKELMVFTNENNIPYKDLKSWKW